MTQRTIRATNPIDDLPPLPIANLQWRAICKALKLSAQQSRVVELLLRGASHKQIALALTISEPTLKTYLQRIFARTSTRGRMHLAMHVLEAALQLNSSGVVEKDDGLKSRRKW